MSLRWIFFLENSLDITLLHCRVCRNEKRVYGGVEGVEWGSFYFFIRPSSAET